MTNQHEGESLDSNININISVVDILVGRKKEWNNALLMREVA